MKKKEFLSGKEYQSKRIANEIMQHKQRKQRRAIENKMRREFGNQEYNTFQNFIDNDESAQIRRFIENNQGDASKFQELPYANGYRVSNSLY